MSQSKHINNSSQASPRPGHHISLSSLLRKQKSNLQINLKADSSQSIVLELSRLLPHTANRAHTASTRSQSFIYRAPITRPPPQESSSPVLSKPLLAMVPAHFTGPSHLAPSPQAQQSKTQQNTRTPAPVKVQPTLRQEDLLFKTNYKIVSMFDISENPASFALTPTEAKVISRLLQIRITPMPFSEVQSKPSS